MNHTQAEELRENIQLALPAGYTCGEIMDEDRIRRGPGGSKCIVEHSSFFIHRTGGDVFDCFVHHIESRRTWEAFREFLIAFQKSRTLPPIGEEIVFDHGEYRGGVTRVEETRFLVRHERETRFSLRGGILDCQNTPFHLVQAALAAMRREGYPVEVVEE